MCVLLAAPEKKSRFCVSTKKQQKTFRLKDEENSDVSSSAEQVTFSLLGRGNFHQFFNFFGKRRNLGCGVPAAAASAKAICCCCHSRYLLRSNSFLTCLKKTFLRSNESFRITMMESS